MFHVVQSGSEFCISATMRENSARSAPLVWSVFTTVGTLTCVVASYCGFTRISLMTDDVWPSVNVIIWLSCLCRWRVCSSLCLHFIWDIWFLLIELRKSFLYKRFISLWFAHIFSDLWLVFSSLNVSLRSRSARFWKRPLSRFSFRASSEAFA